MNYFGITTCKGRLSFLQQTLPLFFGNTPFQHVLVDQCCPDKSGQWVENTFKSHVVYTGTEQEPFYKTKCLNIGGRKAIELGADYLIFFDADSKILPGFSDYIIANATPDKFLFIKPTIGYEDLCGLIVIPKDMFIKSGGFNEKFTNWGIEDIEIRLRLYGLHKFKYDTIPVEFAEGIQHDDSIRTRFYTEKNKLKSLKENNKLMCTLARSYCDTNLSIIRKINPNKLTKKQLELLQVLRAG